jgi:Ser/Thr protein kinase RdoA (MazF antagonist)
MKPVVDKAEVSIDFPDKAYMGSFGRDAGFEVRASDDEVLIRLVREGEDRREVAMHLHYYLLADVLAEMAQAVKQTVPHLDDSHRAPLRDASKALAAALQPKAKAKGKSRGRR